MEEGEKGGRNTEFRVVMWVQDMYMCTQVQGNKPVWVN